MNSRQTQIEFPDARRDLEEEVLDGELFLRDGKNGEIHCLNGGAAIVWLLCNGEQSTVSIADKVATESGLPKKEVHRNVHEAVKQFDELGLLTIHI